MFKLVYRLMIGDFDDFFKSSTIELVNFLYVFFVFATILMMIVLLNLVIAIVSETFAKVTGAETLANNYERANIIYDIEKEITDKFQRKLSKKGCFKKYIYIIKFEDSERGELNETSKKLMLKIDSIETKIEKTDVDLNSILSKVETLENLQTRSLRKIDALKRTLNGKFN